jgi:RND family efflux transporter MFP subunit
VTQVELRDRPLVVRSQGTVSPRTASTLSSEVSGRVIRVAPSFAAGGFFENGELLVRIDPTDYREIVVQARATQAQAALRLEQERAEAEIARREWEELGGDDPSPLTLREPQLAQALASLEAARAAVERAERDLARTEIRAPYAGRVRSERIDVGDFVTRGAALAEIYAVDAAEIRLPLPDDDLAYLDLPLDYRGDEHDAPGPRVVLSARFAGKTHRWEGRIVRTEGEIDRRSRMVHAVARVRDPYARGDDPNRPPLAVGLFVHAEIEGHTVPDAAVVPRAAVRGEDQVLVVSEDDRLHFRTVEIYRRAQDDVIVTGGLEHGERVCISPLAVVTDGMRVRTAEEPS